MLTSYAPLRLLRWSGLSMPWHMHRRVSPCVEMPRLCPLHFRAPPLWIIRIGPAARLCPSWLIARFSAGSGGQRGLSWCEKISSARPDGKTWEMGTRRGKHDSSPSRWFSRLQPGVFVFRASGDNNSLALFFPPLHVKHATISHNSSRHSQSLYGISCVI